MYHAQCRSTLNLSEARRGRCRNLVNLIVPEYAVNPGEVARLRILNGTNALPLFLALPGFAVWQIGFDGVNTLDALRVDMSGSGVTKITPENLFTAPIQLAAQGSRIELLLRAPAKAGSYALASLASDRIRPALGERFEIARFVVASTPIKMRIPTTLPKPTREYPIITDKEIIVRRRFVFGQAPRRDMLTGKGLTIDGVLYQEMVRAARPKVGTCEEWRIENETDDLHPFHLHENSFQLFAINDTPVHPISIRDTFPIPQKLNGTNGSLTLRVRFKQWYGKTVFHCHAITHEDTGMMQNIFDALRNPALRKAGCVRRRREVPSPTSSAMSMRCIGRENARIVGTSW